MTRRPWLPALAAILGAHVLAAQPAALFPEPFELEHHLAHDDGEGNRLVGESVVDTYGGSWIVSRRGDGSRLILDFIRREATEIQLRRGVYWTVSFDRLGDLARRLRVAQGLEPPATAPRAESAAPKPELVVTEVGASRAEAASARSAVRHLRVTAGRLPPVEIWVDSTLRLPPAAVAAVSAFESEVLAASSTSVAPSPAAAPGRYLAAARAFAEGAVAVRTLRPARVLESGRAVGTVEDVVTRAERLETFPLELIAIPEGLRRVPHPLEATVRFLEDERRREQP